MGNVYVRIDSRIRLLREDLPRVVVDRLKESFDHWNPEFSSAKAAGRSTWNIPRTIRTWRERPGELNFPRGGWKKIEAILHAWNLVPDVDDYRVTGNTRVRLPDPKRKLWDHQVDIVNTIAREETVIVKSGTGSGKTTGLLAAIPKIAVPTLVVVHSDALAEQWLERCEIDLGLRPRYVGRIQGARFELQPITIAMQKTLSNITTKEPETARAMYDYFGAVFADECHLFGARTFIEGIDPFPAKFRVGASADHRRKDKKDFLITDLFGEVGVTYEHEELVEKGMVMDVEFRVINSTFEAPWYTARSTNQMSVSEKEIYDRTFVDLVKEMSFDDAREKLWFEHVVREVSAGNQVLIMAHETQHCRAIAAKLVMHDIPFGLLFGTGNSEKGEFKRTVDGLRSKQLMVGVGTYKAVGTGIDVPSVGVAFAVTPIAANEQFVGQVRGRVCRKAEGKTSARLYLVLDPRVYGTKHHRNLKRWNANNLQWDRVREDWVPLSMPWPWPIKRD